MAGFAEAESMPQKSLCYFTAYLESADSGRYSYFIELGRLRGYGRLDIGKGGKISRLDIASLKLGDSFSAQGKVDLAELSNLDLTLDINDMDLSTLFKGISVVKNNIAIKGIVNGKFRIDGKINIPRLSGRLQSRGLRIENQDYSFAFVDLKGTWPLLFIEDGRLFYDGGYYILSGCVDLAYLPDPAAWKDVVLQTGQKNIRWMGWDIEKDTFNGFGLRPDELNVERELKQDDVKLSLKTFINDEVTTKSLKSDVLELEYKMSNGQNIRMRLRQEDEFLGLEHKLKF